MKPINQYDCKVITYIPKKHNQFKFGNSLMVNIIIVNVSVIFMTSAYTNVLTNLFANRLCVFLTRLTRIINAEVGITPKTPPNSTETTKPLV